MLYDQLLSWEEKATRGGILEEMTFFVVFCFFLGEPGKEAGMEEGKGELGGKKEENQRDPGG